MLLMMTMAFSVKSYSLSIFIVPQKERIRRKEMAHTQTDYSVTLCKEWIVQVKSIGLSELLPIDTIHLHSLLLSYRSKRKMGRRGVHR